MAENLHEKGIKVTVAEPADHVIGLLIRYGCLVHQYLRSKGLAILKNGVSEFNPEGSAINVKLSDDVYCLRTWLFWQ